jgi:hypothetical protein
MSSLYRGYNIIHRLGVGTVLIIKAEVDRDDMEKLLGGSYYGLFIVDNYKVELCECETLEANTGNTRLEVGTFGNFVKSYIPTQSLMLEFEIPISSKLIDTINDIRRKKKIVGFKLSYSYNVVILSYSPSIKSGSTNVKKTSPKGGKLSIMTFSTEEIDKMMEELRYAEFIRFEIPIPLISETNLEILKNVAMELKNVEEVITKGDYPNAIKSCRNIIMNYLLKDKDESGKRVLTKELRENILNRIPNKFKEDYKDILNGLSETLRVNLEKHIHKFVKEDTGKLLNIPSKEEAEYVYMMLILILRYISQLTLTWENCQFKT